MLSFHYAAVEMSSEKWDTFPWLLLALVTQIAFSFPSIQSFQALVLDPKVLFTLLQGRVGINSLHR